MATAGERKNNPGCINSSKGLRVYPTLKDGYDAVCSLLVRRYNNKTCYQIFTKYAPSSDGNNPRKYANFVINQLRSKGINVNDQTVLDLSNPYVLQELTLAISKMENGKVLGGETFARNTISEFVQKNSHAFKSGNMSTVKATYNTMAMAPTLQKQVEGTSTEKRQHAIAQSALEQSQKNSTIQQKTEESSFSKTNIVALLGSIAVSAITGNSAMGGVISQLVSNNTSDKA